ncbi:MAG: hypothetical protein ACREQP_01780 [Candidatus Binatia bacterium]
MKPETKNNNRSPLKSIFSAFIFPLSAWLLLAAPAYSLTVDEILALKKAGVSEETLQMLLEREREEKWMAQRAGTWKLGDGRTVYTTEGAPSNSTEYRQEVYPLCIFPQVEVPRRSKK